MKIYTGLIATAELRDVYFFGKAWLWSCLKAVSVPAFVMGSLQGFTHTKCLLLALFCASKKWRLPVQVLHTPDLDSPVRHALQPKLNRANVVFRRKLALVGIIPNHILFSFSSDKDRRTDSRIRRKNTARATRIRKTLGSIPGGDALFFFRLIRLSVLLSLSELKRK